MTRPEQSKHDGPVPPQQYHFPACFSAHRSATSRASVVDARACAPARFLQGEDGSDAVHDAVDSAAAERHRPAIAPPDMPLWASAAMSELEVARVAFADVWVAKDDGSDIVRAGAIAAVGRDYNGNVTARLAGEGSAVTLVAVGAHEGTHTPGDFHRQLIRVVAQLSDAAGAVVVRPVFDQPHGWRWTTDPP
jgi:hypothetical protein